MLTVCLQQAIVLLAFTSIYSFTEGTQLLVMTAAYCLHAASNFLNGPTFQLGQLLTVCMQQAVV
jgi:hypothetical protein